MGETNIPTREEREELRRHLNAPYKLGVFNGPHGLTNAEGNLLLDAIDTLEQRLAAAEARQLQFITEKVHALDEQRKHIDASWARFLEVGPDQEQRVVAMRDKLAAAEADMARLKKALKGAYCGCCEKAIGSRGKGCLECEQARALLSSPSVEVTGTDDDLIPDATVEAIRGYLDAASKEGKP